MTLLSSHHWPHPLSAGHLPLLFSEPKRRGTGPLKGCISFCILTFRKVSGRLNPKVFLLTFLALKKGEGEMSADKGGEANGV